MERYRHFAAVGLFILSGTLSSPPAVAQGVAVPALDPTKAITEYVHVSWGEDEGLPQGSINAIAQTEDGYVWLGTQEGLVRFDGIQFNVFNTSNVEAFQSNDVRVLQRDRQGLLWIGTRNAGLYRYANGSFSSMNVQESLRDAFITSLLEDEQGRLWIGTAGSGLKLLHHGEMISIDVPAQAISALLETETGTLWIGSRDAGLIRYENGEVRAYNRADGLPDEDVTSLAPGRNGGIWIGTRQGGLAHFHDDTFYVATTEHGLPSNRILTLFKDAAGSLWIGTNQAGLTRLHIDLPMLHEGSTASRIQIGASTDNPVHSVHKEAFAWDSFSSRHGLTYDVVKTLFTDREGNLLIGTDGGGLNLLREGKFTTYTEIAGLPDNFVYAIHQDLSGDLWFSTENGVGRLSGRTMSSYSAADGLAADVVTSLASTPDSSVWMGTYDGGLSRLYKGRFTTYTKKDGLPANSVYGLYSDSKGRLWVGTGGGAARIHGDRFTAFTSQEGLSSDLVTVILESRDESVWIGTYNAGLNKLQGDRFVPFAFADTLSNTGILSLYEDDAGLLWIGTFGEGLLRVENGEITEYTTAEGLFNDTILHILEDDLGYLWMSCNRGLFRVSKKQLDDFAAGKIDAITSVAYDKGDGLKTNEFNGGVQSAGWKSRDGRLWFPSKEGVASIDPQNIRINETPPLIEVERVFVDGSELPLEGPVQLAPGADRMEIHYAGLSLVAPEKMRYQYQLIGSDNSWVEAGSRRVAYYTNLEPGRYAFSVRAQNGDGVWSPTEATFSFYHEPFFYQTAWFYLTAVCVLVLGVAGLYRWRLRKLSEQKERLEYQVHVRTRNLEERTADLANALKENKEILSITSHDLKNPLSGIIGMSELLLQDFSEMPKNPALEEGLESIQLMKGEAERMLRIVKELLDKHQARDKIYEHATTCNLTQLAEDVLHRHRKQAELKNIQLIFDRYKALYARCSEDAMLRIADNLMSNAIKFSPPGSRVWLTLTTQGGVVTFAVKDEGPGLTEEDKEKVFGKLQRLSARPTAGEQSTGLGLFIVKQLAEASGATVGVDSVYGEGASFWVTMPLHSDHTEKQGIEYMNAPG